MFDSSLVVQSAASSFNNAALWAPDFFWSALMALPVFAVFWIFAPKIAEKFLPGEKRRDYRVSILAFLVVAIWLIAQGNYGVLRDFSWVGVLIAVLLCACAAFLSRRYYEGSARLSQCLPVNRKWGTRTDYALPAMVVIVAAAAGEPTWAGMALQGGTVAVGWLSGWLLHRRNARETDPKLLVALLIFGAAYGLIMQPEFFRFGQLGRLTAVHLVFLTMFAVALPAYIALHFARPRGWFVRGFYKGARLFAAVAALLLFSLFVITESALAFLAIAGLSFVFGCIFAWRQPADAANGIKSVKHDLWFASLALFGILTALPALTCAAIVLWRISPRGALKKLL
ncbi:MAG: hypothetical protein FWC61_04290 [Proteobacteria bacterium]|nr:hypothetical protein [Pseudomonadota bacterium]